MTGVVPRTTRTGCDRDSRWKSARWGEKRPVGRKGRGRRISLQRLNIYTMYAPQSRNIAVDDGGSIFPHPFGICPPQRSKTSRRNHKLHSTQPCFPSLRRTFLFKHLKALIPPPPHPHLDPSTEREPDQPSTSTFLVPPRTTNFLLSRHLQISLPAHRIVFLLIDQTSGWAEETC